jgi:pseudouridine-5'-phosphate glycosidase
MNAQVALESTVITHGLPRPQNLEIARAMSEAVVQGGAEPRMIAVLDGEIRIGLSDPELVVLAEQETVRKCSLRDLPIIRSTGQSGGTTVSATLHLAVQAGIPVFATGGIGGVHRGKDGDVSADLPALASIPGTVVCAGPKSILDVARTRERLETDVVAVLGWRTDEFPAFYCRESGLPVDQRVESADDVAEIIRHRDAMGLRASVLVVVPCPDWAAMPAEEMQGFINESQLEAAELGVRGKDLTPYLLNRLAERTEGRSLAANRALLLNNARVAAEISCAFSGTEP